MAKNRTKATRLLLSLAVATALPLSAQVAHTRVETLTKALPKAESTNNPLLVLVHGSSWHTASQRLNDLVWQDIGFTNLLSSPVVMTNIHIRQNQTKDAVELEKENRKGWKDKPVLTYPAIQVYGSDGQLLATVQGRTLIKAASPDKLAALLNPLLNAANRRKQLLAQYHSISKTVKQSEALELLCKLNELPINKEPEILKMLEQVDPNDSSGWQARISFAGWHYMRGITKRLEDEQAEQVLAETVKALSSDANTPDQRTIILGAKGRALVALNRYDDAWLCFQQVANVAPGSASGSAIFKYGLRVAGSATREIVDPESPLANADIGKNLTKSKTNFRLSSQAHDDGSQHHTLLSGPPSSSGTAFHTDNEYGAHIIIDLGGGCELRALKITNRTSIHERAKGLTVWVSTNQREWKQIWQADTVEAVWPILLKAPVRASYIKVGLPKDTKNYLHLHAVDAYGKRL